MSIQTCMNCQGTDMYNTQMSTPVRISKNKSFWVNLMSVPVECTVCLSCGFIAPHVDPAGLEKLRAWKAEDTRK
jgi:hypothetical protein